MPRVCTSWSRRCCGSTCRPSQVRVVLRCELARCDLYVGVPRRAGVPVLPCRARGVAQGRARVCVCAGGGAAAGVHLARAERPRLLRQGSRSAVGAPTTREPGIARSESFRTPVVIRPSPPAPQRSGGSSSSSGESSDTSGDVRGGASRSSGPAEMRHRAGGGGGGGGGGVRQEADDLVVVAPNRRERGTQFPPPPPPPRFGTDAVYDLDADVPPMLVRLAAPALACLPCACRRACVCAFVVLAASMQRSRVACLTPSRLDLCVCLFVCIRHVHSLRWWRGRELRRALECSSPKRLGEGEGG